MTVNSVTLVGFVGRDAECRTFPDGSKVANLSLATTSAWNDKASGERREATEWHRLVLNNRLADIAEQYVKKGSLICVMGSIKTRKYSQEGVEKYVTEIRVDKMHMLPSKSGNAAAPEGEEHGESVKPASTPVAATPAVPEKAATPTLASSPAPAHAHAVSTSGFDDLDDEIPF